MLSSENDAKLRAIASAEIADKELQAETLKQEIRQRQDDLLTIEAKLLALRVFRDAYVKIETEPETIDILPRRMPDPVEMTATASLDTFVPQIPPFLQTHQVLSDERSPPLIPAKLSPKAFAEQRATAVVADVVQVEQWAAQRGVQFNGWDDLPGVNKKRKELGVAPFVQKHIAVPARVK